MPAEIINVTTEEVLNTSEDEPNSEVKSVLDETPLKTKKLACSLANSFDVVKVRSP